MKQDEYRALVDKTCETVTEADPTIVQELSAKIMKALPKELSDAKVRGVIDSPAGVVFKLRHPDTGTRWDHSVSLTPVAPPVPDEEELEDKEEKGAPEIATKKPPPKPKTGADDLETK